MCGCMLHVCVSECYEMSIYPPAVKINLDTVEVRKPSFAKLNILAVWKVKCRKPKIRERARDGKGEMVSIFRENAN